MKKEYYLSGSIDALLENKELSASIDYTDIAKEKENKERKKRGWLPKNSDDYAGFVMAHIDQEEGKDKKRIEFSPDIVGKQIYLDDLLEAIDYLNKRM